MEEAAEELPTFIPKPAELAWVCLAAGVIAYDLIALNTNKVETLSNVVWRSLAKPNRWPIYMGVWFGLTYHLFFSPSAIESYKLVPTNTKQKRKKEI